MKITKENIDEYMFRLLENDLSPKETEALRQLIAENAEYQKLWQNWKNTVVSPENLIPHTDFSYLKKESKKTVLLWWHYAAAASIIIILGLGILMTQTGIKETTFTEKNGNKKPVISVPEMKPVNQATLKSDSIKDYKEKIKHYAQEKNSPILKKQFNEDRNSEIEIKYSEKKVAINEPINNEFEIIPIAVTNIQTPTLANSSISVEYYQEDYIGGDIETKTKPNFFKRMFSKPSIKIVNDTTTKLNKKLIIENDKYKILAGF